MRFPSGWTSSAACSTSRTDNIGGAARRTRCFPGARKPPRPSGLRMQRVELVLRDRPVAPSKLDRGIVEPAGREAAIEMPQPRNDHAHDRDLDIGPGLIEHEEIEAR